MRIHFKLALTLCALFFISCENKPLTTESTKNSSSGFSLDSLSRHTFNWFWDLGNSDNGQLPDRWPTENFSSIASTGFGLTTYLIGIERGYIIRGHAAERVLNTLQFLHELPKGDQESGRAGYKGFFYHFLDQKTGLRFHQVELSTIDTALLMAGILSCQTYFDQNNETENQIRNLADVLYRAVEWDWAMNGETTMSMGWHPERGLSLPGGKDIMKLLYCTYLHSALLRIQFLRKVGRPGPKPINGPIIRVRSL